MTIRARTVLAVAGPALVLLVLFPALVWAEVRTARLGDLDARLRSSGAGIATLVERDHIRWEVNLDPQQPPADLVGGLFGWKVEVLDGPVLAQSGGATDAPPRPTLAAPAGDERPQLVAADRTTANGGQRVWTGWFLVVDDQDPDPESVGMPTATGPAIVEITLAQDLAPVRSELRQLLGVLIGTGAALTVLAVSAAWVLSAWIVAPLEDMARRAEAVRGGDPIPRLRGPRPTGDEVDRLARVLEEAFGRLHEAWLRQARFTSAASHELRTPLAVIRSQAEVALRHERTPQAYKEALTVVVDGAVRLQETLDGLLLLARADARALSHERERVCLSDLVDAAITRLAPLHRDGPSILRVGSDSGLIDGDARQLEVLLQNLLTNAVRHTPPSGRITVALWVDAQHVGLAVEDTGEGIPPDALPRVFDRFFRVDLHRSRGHGGSGLGLSIVQAIAAAHGGTVEVRSTLGVGTRFEVRLPRPDLKPS